MKEYTLGFDFWEGSGEIDEKKFLEGGCRFFFVRINDMNGGHHKDQNFDAQWDQAVPFYRAPYFVYNPWVDGIGNYNYLRSIVPPDVRVFMLDTEVRKPGYPPEIYGQELATCISFLLMSNYSIIMYTGWGYLDILKPWPTNLPYCWARYPYILHPADGSTLMLTWEQLHEKIQWMTWYPGSSNLIPGPCNLWQCSGDSIILPGTNRKIDIILFNGNVQEFQSYYQFPAAQCPQGVAPPEPVDLPEGKILRFETLVAGQRIRTGPGIQYPVVSRVSKGQIFPALDLGGSDVWIKIGEGQWIAVRHGDVTYLKEVEE